MHTNRYSSAGLGGGTYDVWLFISLITPTCLSERQNNNLPEGANIHRAWHEGMNTETINETSSLNASLEGNDSLLYRITITLSIPISS